MDERQKNAEQEFFQWLPSAVSPSVLKDIQTSYIQINALLVKSRVLLRSIVNVTSIRQIEVALQQAKNVLANKRLRNTATKLLTAYLGYLRRKNEMCESVTLQQEIETEDGWIKYDFANSRLFERTKPAYCSLAGETITGKKETLLKESENWGIVELIWGKDYSSRQGKGVIKLIEYRPFCPYTVDLEFYKEARRAFSIEEWIDVLISAADYNPAGYDSEQQKLYVLRRLLPFVEKRLNLMELAPKGTGKSYVYQKISKRGWLISGGTVSRASLIYDNQKKTGGLLTRFDFVGFDEIQSMTFDKPSQIQTALKDYMEFGEVQGFDAQVVADAGVIVLGNINASRFNVNENMMEEVSRVFSESASLDRFHGFIPGWKIPRMHQGLVANGWALNTEYFAEVLHLLRDDLTYTTIVDECLAVPAKPDKRDLTAIKRLCTAFVKLLYPNATCKDDIPADEFIKYCLEPAKEMRGVIKKQLCIIDPKEFNVPGKKDIPDIQYNYM